MESMNKVKTSTLLLPDPSVPWPWFSPKQAGEVAEFHYILCNTISHAAAAARKSMQGRKVEKAELAQARLVVVTHYEAACAVVGKPTNQSENH